MDNIVVGWGTQTCSLILSWQSVQCAKKRALLICIWKSIRDKIFFSMYTSKHSTSIHFFLLTLPLFIMMITDQNMGIWEAISFQIEVRNDWVERERESKKISMNSYEGRKGVKKKSTDKEWRRLTSYVIWLVPKKAWSRNQVSNFNCSSNYGT